MIKTIGIDVGGTFTDLFMIDENRKTLIEKVPSTPQDPIIGILNAIKNASVDLSRVENIINGSTIATNAVIERKLPPTAFITTKGFRDLIEIGRYHRKELYNPYLQKPEPLIPRKYRFEVEERIDSKGEVIQDLNEENAEKVISNILNNGIKNIAIGFINSYMNSVHEEKMAEILSRFDRSLNISLSSKVLPRIRPQGRFITTILNASLRPLTETYINRLREELGKRGFRGNLWMIQSNGGIASPEKVIRGSESLLFSGPAAGVSGAASLCSYLGINNSITMDMGGTSCDISLVEGASPVVSREIEVDWDMPVPIPMVDIDAIGAGGGSLAWVDSQGILKVGPESAGADPGPVFYGRGNKQPTVSDANLVLGYLNPNRLLSGRLKINEKDVYLSMREIGKKLGIDDVKEVAKGIITIANQNMANAISENLIKRGRDPRDFVLVTFGGGGPLHAVNIAKKLSIPKVIIPKNSSVFSAFGSTLLNARYEYQRTYLTNLNKIDISTLKSMYNEMEENGRSNLSKEGFERIEIKRFAELRYQGQSYELEIEVTNNELDLKRMALDFEKEHKRVYGIVLKDTPISLVNLRVSAIGIMANEYFTKNISNQVEEHIKIGKRQIYFIDDKSEMIVDVYDGEVLQSGNKIIGPAIIEYDTTTVLLEPLSHAQIDGYGNMIITIEGGDNHEI